ncbi:uncharacterized protein J8A68_005870 [[Candida] subhashii]|uniref:Probable guanine deaminase n=1 Tax=[Candida] subhashii TaxID=561895 RepID=A0A8J5UUG4_9ASCO|nr:uncharacterized protein J8A68_005870 [[Candida] subhashii]KAG7660604.1 hypothetical protein J8A68_005870 [[Candida] subhashii]
MHSKDINEMTISSSSKVGSKTIKVKATKSIQYTLYYGTFIHTPELNNFEICFNTILGVNERGVIDFIYKDYKPEEHNDKSPIEFFLDSHDNDDHSRNRYRHGRLTLDYIDYSNDTDTFFMPGFIDTHIHASQFPNMGIGSDSTLLDWLNDYTFPLEKEFTDNNKEGKFQFSRDIYSKVINKTLSNGTTCASYFTTIDSATTNLFAELLLEMGQRGFVGKVCMNINDACEEYKESFEDCQESMENIIVHLSNINPDNETLVKPIVTPRFAPVCSKDLLGYLGELSRDNNLPIQTHISENKNEIELVKKLFPDFPNYSSVYDGFDLLTSSTILAHAIHLSPDERKLIKKRGCSISHCPTSNSFISSGEAPIKQFLYHDNINVSLGTDVSGGFEPSILATMKHSILVSHHRCMKSDKPNRDRLTISDAIYMATLGGAKAVGLEHMIGTFEIGKKFDAQLIDLSCEGSKVDVFDWQLPTSALEQNEKIRKMKDLLGKLIFCGDDRNCVKVWCNGRLIVDKHANRRYDRWVMVNKYELDE